MSTTEESTERENWLPLNLSQFREGRGRSITSLPGSALNPH